MVSTHRSGGAPTVRRPSAERGRDRVEVHRLGALLGAECLVSVAALGAAQVARNVAARVADADDDLLAGGSFFFGDSVARVHLRPLERRLPRDLMYRVVCRPAHTKTASNCSSSSARRRAAGDDGARPGDLPLPLPLTASVCTRQPSPRSTTTVVEAHVLVEAELGDERLDALGDDVDVRAAVDPLAEPLGLQLAR